MQPKCNQDGGQTGMGAGNCPDPSGMGHNVSAPTMKGEGSDVNFRAWQASKGSSISSIQPLVDGPND